ncbi:MAG: hypothetical protein WBQ85_04335 [Candidatus Sulfotelmatobacter sp.]
MAVATAHVQYWQAKLLDPFHGGTSGEVATEYWISGMAAGDRDQTGNAVKFVPPTIANGKVYVSTRTEVDVHGLLP